MRKFGDIVVDEGYATDDQIDSALRYQERTDVLVGKILVDMHRITSAEFGRIAEYIESDAGKGKRFGEAAVELDSCTGKDVHDALERQRTSKGLLGDLLVALGRITVSQRNEIIEMQMSEMGG